MPLSPLDTLIALPDRLAQLPPYFTYKDVLTIVFGEDEDAFLDAYCDGRLPLAVRAICEETLGVVRMQVWLLRRSVRLLGDLVRAGAGGAP